ncbi:FYVE zinc finger-domain-containing protein [Chytriomyces sp. MP71]|nr:FYVE zinc finger-domain-containing protein [Chytriomyces sp. MP71]
MNPFGSMVRERGRTRTRSDTDKETTNSSPSLSQTRDGSGDDVRVVPMPLPPVPAPMRGGSLTDTGMGSGGGQTANAGTAFGSKLAKQFAAISSMGSLASLGSNGGGHARVSSSPSSSSHSLSTTAETNQISGVSGVSGGANTSVRRQPPPPTASAGFPHASALRRAVSLGTDLSTSSSLTISHENHMLNNAHKMRVEPIQESEPQPQPTLGVQPQVPQPADSSQAPHLPQPTHLQIAQQYQHQQQYNPSVYACPICGTETKNLLHLNHHLDKAHSIPTSPDDDLDDPGKLILNWFKKTGENAQRVLNQTGENLGLRKGVSIDALNQLANGVGTSAAQAGLADPGTNLISLSAFPRNGGAFDLNPNDDLPAHLLPPASSSDSAALEEAAGLFVSRAHWQRDAPEGRAMTCHHAAAGSSCREVLITGGVKMGKMVVGAAGVGSVRVHCRKCGNVFCEEHVSWQMRLTVGEARHDTVTGVWARVCWSCFSGREGYLDVNGVTRTRTSTFVKARKNMSDVVSLEINKLESRYEKLSSLYAEIPVSPKPKSKSLSSRLTTGLTSSLTISSAGPNFRGIDQSVVAWQDDSEVSSCPICSSSFSSLFNPLNRRHHCRLCGRVVCGLDTCSTNIPLFPRGTSVEVASSKTPETSGSTEEPGVMGHTKSALHHEVKVCTDCKKLVFRRKTALLEQMHKHEVVSLYEVSFLERPQSGNLAAGKHELTHLFNQEYLQVKQQVEDLLPKFNNLIMALSSQSVIKKEDREYIVASRHRKTLMDHFANMEKIGKRIKALACSTTLQQRLQDNLQISIIQYLQAHMFTLSLMPKVTPPAGAATAGSSASKIQEVKFSDMQRLDAASKALEVMEGQEAMLRTQLEDAVRRRRLEDAGALREALDDVEAEVARLKEEVMALQG